MAATQKNPAELEKARALAHVPWCEEYEKMISGMLYAASAPDLTAARYRARAFAHAYNTYFPPATQDPTTGFTVLAATRQEMLQGIIGRLGEHVFIEPPFNIDYGCNITLGARFYANFNLTILDCSLVTIGARCMFGPNVSIFAATHETGVKSRREDVEYGRPVVVGDDCWVGGGAVILPGVTIGRGCTVGAGSVVTRDVEDFCVVMGQPARVVKRVEEVPVEFLEESG